MRLTTLFEKEKEIFNKTRGLDEGVRNGDQQYTKRDILNTLKTDENSFPKVEKSRRGDTFTGEEFREKEREMMEILSKLNERCEENDIIINNLAKEKVELYEDLMEERKKNQELFMKLEKSYDDFVKNFTFINS